MIKFNLHYDAFEEKCQDGTAYKRPDNRVHSRNSAIHKIMHCYLDPIVVYFLYTRDYLGFYTWIHLFLGIKFVHRHIGKLVYIVLSVVFLNLNNKYHLYNLHYWTLLASARSLTISSTHFNSYSPMTIMSAWVKLCHLVERLSLYWSCRSICVVWWCNWFTFSWVDLCIFGHFTVFVVLTVLIESQLSQTPFHSRWSHEAWLIVFPAPFLELIESVDVIHSWVSASKTCLFSSLLSSMFFIRFVRILVNSLYIIERRPMIGL